jgi:hypothetical protein
MRQHLKSYWFAYIVFLCVLIIWASGPFWMKWAYENPYNKFVDNLGQFGDVFGYLNAAFSGLAFAGIIVTIVLQSRDLRDTRSVAEKSQKELERQAQAMTLQAFEQTFFQLVGLHNDILSAMQFGNERGRRIFRSSYDNLREKRASKKTIRDSYAAYYKRYGSTMGHYFRNLYHIVKFVDRSDVKDKGFYLGILFAQLSKYELLILFYNCLSEVGANFKPYLEKDGLLENMNYDALISPKDAFEFASATYGDNAHTVMEWATRKASLKPAS